MHEIDSNLKRESINRKNSDDYMEEEEENADNELSPMTNIYDENFTEIRSIVIFKAIFELFATFLFIFLIIVCQKDIKKFILGMWIILIVFGNLSGAHLNPAVSLGFYINKGKYSSGLFKFVMYVIAQLLGCYLGILVSYLMTGKVDFLSIPDRNIFQVLFSEMFFTGTLFFLIISVSTPHTTPSSKGYINALFVVCWFFVIVNAGALISGAAFNPAVLFAMNSVAYFAGIEEAKNAFQKLISMIIVQFTGVIIFAYIFKNVILKYDFGERNRSLEEEAEAEQSSTFNENDKIKIAKVIKNNNKRFSHNVMNEFDFNIKELENKY